MTIFIKHFNDLRKVVIISTSMIYKFKKKRLTKIKFVHFYVHTTCIAIYLTIVTRPQEYVGTKYIVPNQCTIRLPSRFKIGFMG